MSSQELFTRKISFFRLGGTASDDFTVTPGAYQTAQDKTGTQVGSFGYCDAFVMKFSPDGTRLWATFLGGPNYDRAYGVEVDGDIQKETSFKYPCKEQGSYSIWRRTNGPLHNRLVDMEEAQEIMNYSARHIRNIVSYGHLHPIFNSPYGRPFFSYKDLIRFLKGRGKWRHYSASKRKKDDVERMEKLGRAAN